MLHLFSNGKQLTGINQRINECINQALRNQVSCCFSQQTHEKQHSTNLCAANPPHCKDYKGK